MLKNLVIWLVIGLVLMTVFNQFNTRQAARSPMEYSQFLDEVKAGRIAKRGETQTYTAFVAGLLVLLWQRPHRHVKYVVKHANSNAHESCETRIIEAGSLGERLTHKPREVD